MKYIVTGQNRDTGARMTLEFETDSKAAAERKANQAGMHVNRVEAAGGKEAKEYRAVRQPRGGYLKWLIMLAILAALAWYFWPRLAGLAS